MSLSQKLGAAIGNSVGFIIGTAVVAMGTIVVSLDIPWGLL